jgi:ankyrin repeat protein
LHGFKYKKSSENRMFGHPVVAKSILVLIGLTAANCVEAGPQDAAPNSLNPAAQAPISASQADSTSLHCALKQYIPWVRAQGRPLDPDLKAKKLQEIDTACGSSLHLSNVLTAYDQLPGVSQEGKQPVGAATPAAPAKPTFTGPTFAELVDGPLPTLEAYLSQPGVDINERKANFETLLDVAADHNKADAAKLLLDHGADIESSPPQNNRYYGSTALYHAAYMNSLDVAELLIGRGARVDSGQESYGSHTPTPLCAAASQGNLQMVVALLKHGAEVDAEFGVHQTPLSEALAHGHMEVAHLLIDHGAKLRPEFLASAAMQARVEAVHLLLTIPIEQVTKDEALRFAILGGPEHSAERIQIVQDLLDHGANIDNLKSVPDVIPLMFATSTDMVDYLLAHGANQQAKLPGAQIAKGFVCNKASKDPVAMLQILIARGTISAAQRRKAMHNFAPVRPIIRPCWRFCKNTTSESPKQTPALLPCKAHSRPASPLPKPAK